MDIFIAILWYLQVLFTGTPYTTGQIDQLVIDNQQSVDVVLQDAQLLDNVVTSYSDVNSTTYDPASDSYVIGKDEEEQDMEPMR